MLDKPYRVLTSLTAIVALGLGGSVSAFAQERHHDPWAPDPYEEEEEIEIDEDEPEFVPPIVPIAPEAIGDPTSVNPLVAADRLGRFALDVGLHATVPEDDLSLFMASPILSARIPLMVGMERGGTLELGADIGMLLLTPLEDPIGLRTSFAVGNPFLSAGWLQDLGNANLNLGIGVALPVARVEGPRAAERELGYQAATGMRAGFNQWLWAPDRLAVVAPVRLESTVGRALLGVDGAAGALIGVRDDSGEAEFVGQIAGEIGYMVGARSVLGLRGLGHWGPVLPDTDTQFTFALEPGFRTGLGERGFLGLRLTVPMNEPYGFAFERGGNYALNVTFGSSF